MIYNLVVKCVPEDSSNILLIFQKYSVLLFFEKLCQEVHRVYPLAATLIFSLFSFSFFSLSFFKGRNKSFLKSMKKTVCSFCFNNVGCANH